MGNGENELAKAKAIISGAAKPGDVYAAKALSAETRKLLTGVVRKLTADCIDFYKDDQAILEQMSREGLEFAVLDYLSKRDWYRRPAEKPRKPIRTEESKNAT